MNENDNKNTPPVRGRLTFRLRTVMVLMLAFSIWIGLARRGQMIDQQVATQIAQLAPDAQIHWDNPVWLPLERRTFLSRITRISVDVEGQVLRRLPLERLSRLKTVTVDNDLAEAQRLSERLPDVAIEIVVPEPILVDVY